MKNRLVITIDDNVTWPYEIDYKMKIKELGQFVDGIKVHYSMETMQYHIAIDGDETLAMLKMKHGDAITFDIICEEYFKEHCKSD